MIEMLKIVRFMVVLSPFVVKKIIIRPNTRLITALSLGR